MLEVRESTVTRTILQPYTNHTLAIHKPYTNHTQTIHKLCTNHTRTIDEPYTNHTRTIHEPYTNHTRTIHEPYTNHTRTIHEPYTNHTKTTHLTPKYINLIKIFRLAIVEKFINSDESIKSYNELVFMGRIQGEHLVFLPRMHSFTKLIIQRAYIQIHHFMIGLTMSRFRKHHCTNSLNI